MAHVASTTLFGSEPALPADYARIDREPIDWFIVLAITIMPITWIPLVDFGFSSLEFRHFAGFTLLGATAMSGQRIANVITAFKVPWVWLALLLYALIIVLSATHGRIYGVALGLRSFFWLLVAWVIFSRMPSARTVHLGAIGGFAAFLIAIEISAQQTGTSTIDAMWNFFTTGSFVQFRYQFLPSVMQAFGNPWESDVESGNSANSFAAVSLHIIFLYMASRPAFPKYPMRLAVDAAVVAVMTLFVFAVLSRAVVATFVIGAVIAGVLSLTRQRTWLILFVAIFAGAFFVVYVGTADSGYGAALEERLFEDKASFFARLHQWTYGIPMIEEKPWFGHGVQELDTGMDFHNLFLGAFVGGGIFTFFTACFYYISILYIWVRMVLRAFGGWDVAPGWSALWVPSIALVAFVRPMLGGGLGELGADGWIMLGIGMSAALRFTSAPVKIRAGA